MSAERYPPLARHEVEALGIRTNYYTAGSEQGEAIVLLHGMSASADSFRELMHELEEGYRLVAPDIPGFGYSENMAPYTFEHLIEWLAAFMARLDLRPAHLLGHSFGGALAVSFALAYPGDVSSLILLAPSVLRPGKVPQWLRGLAQSRLSEKVLEAGVLASRLMLQRQMRAAFYEPERFDESLWQRRAADYGNARASAAVLRASALHDIRGDLAQLKQPSCVIWGKNDPVLDPADAKVLDELMPRSTTTLHLLDECGHIAQIEQRGQVVQIIGDFLGTGEQS